MHLRRWSLEEATKMVLPVVVHMLQKGCLRGGRKVKKKKVEEADGPVESLNIMVSNCIPAVSRKKSSTRSVLSTSVVCSTTTRCK